MSPLWISKYTSRTRKYRPDGTSRDKTDKAIANNRAMEKLSPAVHVRIAILQISMLPLATLSVIAGLLGRLGRSYR
jgi:hypothetical protein